MHSILIVDDEPRVLQGLRRMLRAMRGEWHLEFAEGGVEAIRLAAENPFDVVLSDMRMPNIDGAELFREVRRISPETVRIILSGQCDDSTVIKCVEPAHQFLTKPCDSQLIRSTVGRACKLRTLLPDPALQRETSRLTSIPSLPPSYDMLTRELNSSSPSLQRLEEIVSRDIGMTAKVMQLVSSSFFGAPRDEVDAREAVRLLGADRLRLIANETNAFRSIDAEPAALKALERWRKHSFHLADLARSIARSAAGDVVARHAYLAGLFHCLSVFVGGLAIHAGCAPNNPAAMANDDDGEWASASAGPEGCCGAGCRLEKELRADVSACLLALWGLPEPVVQAVAFFRNPSESEPEAFAAVTALHIAHAASPGCGEKMRDRDQIMQALDMAYLERIGCVDRVDHWIEECSATVHTGSLLSI